MSAIDLLGAQIKLADLCFNNFEQNEVSEETHPNEYQNLDRLRQYQSEFRIIDENTVNNALRWAKRYSSWATDWSDAYMAWLEFESGKGAHERAILYATFKVYYLMDYLRKRSI